MNQIIVPPEKLDALREIAAKPDNFYTGYLRDYLCKGPDGIEVFSIDTRYDTDLIAVGILPEKD